MKTERWWAFFLGGGALVLAAMSFYQSNQALARVSEHLGALEELVVSQRWAPPPEVSATNGDVSATTGDVSVYPARSEAERILELNPPTLTTGELAEIEGVTPRKILYHITEAEGGAFYTDRHGRRWGAAKQGKAWAIENPFRKGSE